MTSSPPALFSDSSWLLPYQHQHAAVLASARSAGVTDAVECETHRLMQIPSGYRLGRRQPGLRTMFMLTARVIAAAALGVVAVCAATGARSQAITCDWYANTALQQQKTNVDRKCGFKGEAWSFDRAAHMEWCRSVGPTEWKRQAQYRDQELAKCAAGKR